MKESEVAQLCQILCDPVDCSLPGSSLHGILQARILEWGAISFSRGSSHPRDWRIEPGSPTLQADSLTSEPSGKPFSWARVLRNLVSSWFLFLIWANHIEILQIRKYAMLSQYFYLYVCLWFFLLPEMTIICLTISKLLVFQDSEQISLCLKILPDHF